MLMPLECAQAHPCLTLRVPTNYDANTNKNKFLQAIAAKVARSPETVSHRWTGTQATVSLSHTVQSDWQSSRQDGFKDIETQQVCVMSPLASTYAEGLVVKGMQWDDGCVCVLNLQPIAPAGQCLAGTPNEQVHVRSARL